jgi:hypothetical protein
MATNPEPKSEKKKNLKFMEASHHQEWNTRKKTSSTCR